MRTGIRPQGMAIPQLVPSQITGDVLLGFTKSFMESLTPRSAQTRARYDRALREFARWFELDGRFLFAVDDVYRYREYMSKQQKLSPASIATYLTGLRQFFEFLHQHDVITYNPARYVRSPVGSQVATFEALTKEEVIRLMDSVDQNDRLGIRDNAIIRLMVEYGITESELVRLNAGDYVFIAGSGVLKLEGGNESRVLLRSETAMLLNRYFSSRPSHTREEPLFLSDGNRTRGMRMTTRGIRERVNHYLKLAGIRNVGTRNVTPQSLKHTAAMLMAASGSSVDEIKYRMRFGSLARARKYVQQALPTV